MAQQANTELLRQLPPVNDILHVLEQDKTETNASHQILLEETRATVDSARQSILSGKECDISLEALAQTTRQRMNKRLRPSLRRVINASGVIIHTNLGRSPLAAAAKAAVDDVIAGYSTLEYNTDKMARGSRHNHCESLICAITGAEAAIAVNNNAAAVMMILSEFASGHEAVVSRGELIEIGGSFRIPDIMAQSHATMVEVGTTNKTHPADYERALTPQTSMFLKVHPSNYRTIGFTKSVTVDELRAIADKENENRSEQDAVLVYEDQGSGSFVRLDAFGEYAEPTVAESMARGADLVSFSGDKLLGGPQAGIIVGNKKLIARLKKNPLARVLRLDKMTLAALEATLRIHLDTQRALKEIPTVRMLSESAEDVRERSERLMGMLEKSIPEGAANMRIVEAISRAGGGALPMCDIATYAVEIDFKTGNAQDCEEYLIRTLDTPIIGRIQQDCLLFDTRTVLDDMELETIATSMASYFNRLRA